MWRVGLVHVEAPFLASDDVLHGFAAAAAASSSAAMRPHFVQGVRAGADGATDVPVSEGVTMANQHRCAGNLAT